MSSGPIDTVPAIASHSATPRGVVPVERLEVGADSPSLAAVFGCLMFLAGATAWAYGTSFDGVTIFDDVAFIQPELLSGGWFEGPIANRPLVQASLVLNYRIGGLNLWGYHAFNLLVHIVSGCLLFGMVGRTLALPACRTLRLSPLAAQRLAFASALIWLLHPLNTQSVTYLIQRCESLAGLFTLACLYAAIRGATGGPRWLWYGASVISFGLALASKQHAMTTPLILFVYDFVFLTPTVREIVRKRWPLYLGLALSALVALPSLWSILMAPTSSAGFHLTNVTPWQYARSQPGVILHYLRLAIWPEPLCLDYRWMIAKTPVEILVPGVILVTLFAASLWAVRRRHPLGFLGLSFFLLLAPTSSFAPLADLAFEHRMYLPLACLTTGFVCLFVLSTLQIAERRAWPTAATATFFAIMLLSTSSVLGTLTARRNLDYHSPIRLWTSVVRVRPLNYRGWANLGSAYDLAGDQRRAREGFERSISIHDRDAGSWLGLGLSCLKLDDLDRARWAFEKCLEVDPKMVDAASNLGVIAARLDDHEAAVKHFDRALVIQPEFSVGHYNRADSLLELGRDVDAVEALQTALKLTPDFPQAARKLAWIRATSSNADLRDGSEAVRLVEAECHVAKSESPHTWDAYGAALAEAGRYDEAVRAADRAVELARARDKSSLAEEFSLRKSSYETHQPYRVTRHSTEPTPEEEVSP